MVLPGTSLKNLYILAMKMLYVKIDGGGEKRNICFMIFAPAAIANLYCLRTTFHAIEDQGTHSSPLKNLKQMCVG